MADTEDVDSTEESGVASADHSSSRDGSRPLRSGSHALGADLEPDGEAVDELGVDGKELVSVGAPGAAVARAGKHGGAVARTRQKKVKTTPRQKQLAETERRTGPVRFVRESIGELQKVVYPTGQQLVNYFVVVLIFVLFIIAIVSLLDLAFGKAILAVFS